VLVFSSAGLGDSLLDSVAIRALAESFPGIEIHAVVHHRRPDISIHNPFLHKLHFLRKGPPAFVRLWRELQDDGPWDAILYLSCHDPEARCLGFLLNKHATAGLAWRTEFPFLCAYNIEEPGLQRAHLSTQALRVAEQFSATTSYQRMVYEVAANDRSALSARLVQAGFPVEKLPQAIIFQLGGGGAAYRDWPVEHFLDLGNRLAADGIAPLVILGGPDHRKKADAFAGRAAFPFYDMVGRLPLPLSAALIEGARCLVSTDTGIMHLGFALGTPTVALLHCSPGRARVGPLADTHLHEMLELPKPEGYHQPSDASMKNLRPEAVFPLVKKALARRGEHAIP